MSRITFDDLYNQLTYGQREYIDNWVSHSIVLKDFERNRGTILTDRVHIVLFAYNEFVQRIASDQVDELSIIFSKNIPNELVIPSLCLSKESFINLEADKLSYLINTKLEQYNRILMGNAAIDEFVEVKDDYFESLELEATKVAIRAVNNKDETFWNQDNIAILYQTQALVLINAIHQLKHDHNDIIFNGVQNDLPESLQEFYGWNSIITVSDSENDQENNLSIVEVPSQIETRITTNFEEAKQWLNSSNNIDAWGKKLNPTFLFQVKILVAARKFEIENYFGDWKQLNGVMFGILLDYLIENKNPCRTWFFNLKPVQEFLELPLDIWKEEYLALHLWIEKAAHIRRQIEEVFTTMNYNEVFMEANMTEMVTQHYNKQRNDETRFDSFQSYLIFVVQSYDRKVKSLAQLN